MATNHRTRFSGIRGSVLRPFTASCHDCEWVVGGTPELVELAAKGHKVETWRFK